jgi:hypothetical protein
MGSGRICFRSAAKLSSAVPPAFTRSTISMKEFKSKGLMIAEWFCPSFVFYTGEA